MLQNRNGSSLQFSFGNALCLISAFFAAIALAVTVDLRPSEIVKTSYGVKWVPFEFFGLSGTLFLIFLCVQLLKKNWPKIYIASIVMIGFAYLPYVTEISLFKSSDYKVYESAANNVLQEKSIYNCKYLYPPLPAFLLAKVISQNQSLAKSILNKDYTEQRVLQLVYFQYQAMQFFLALACALATIFLLHKQTSFSSTHIGLTCFLLFTVNQPLFRTFRHNQINFWVLLSMIFFILWRNNRPVFAGLSCCIGIHFKIFPIIFLIPLFFKKKWQGLISLIFFLMISFIMPLVLSLPGSYMNEFLKSFEIFPQGKTFRDNSIHSLCQNFFPFLTGLQFTMIYRVIFLGIILLFIYRCWSRAKFISSETDELFYFLETTVFFMLLSPLSWEHHYVFITPLLIFGIVGATDLKTSITFIASTILCLFIPTFDVFPFSYHRISGLLLILFLAPMKTGEKTVLSDFVNA
ncbi:MAG: DUF2029 domain-containing protein [Spirochaetales bacterium]|nr:DUF2029 domain-containing protein [Spirochaetales bacterium]